MEYNEPTLVLFTDYVQSACGGQSAAVGPFYYPGDEKLYIDLSFYDELEKKFQARGDFAMAYVIAYEVGHYVQTLLSLNKDLNYARGRVSETELNVLTVRTELQANYLAGVWARHAESMNLLMRATWKKRLMPPTQSEMIRCRNGHKAKVDTKKMVTCKTALSLAELTSMRDISPLTKVMLLI